MKKVKVSKARLDKIIQTVAKIKCPPVKKPEYECKHCIPCWRKWLGYEVIPEHQSIKLAEALEKFEKESLKKKIIVK